MGWMTVVVGSFVLGQVALPSTPEAAPPAGPIEVAGPEQAREVPAPAADHPGALQPIPESSPEPVPALHRVPPPEMVAKALEPRPTSNLTGRPMSLLQAISSTATRRQQLDAVTAYWRLVEAVAAYHFMMDDVQRLSRLPGQGPAMRAARASSAAMLQEAELKVVVAQHELAGMMLLPPDALMRLPADRPHVGPYQTRFDELFSAWPAQGRTRMIDRTLPIRRKVVESRASAVAAAEAEEEAATNALQQGHGGLADVLAAMGRSRAQREAFMASVCRYNDDIAEYVFAVATPDVNGRALLEMLITPTANPDPVVIREDEAVVPAGYAEPVPTPAVRPNQNVPTPAVRPNQNVPTPAVRPNQNVPTPAVRPNQNVPTPAVRPQEKASTPAPAWSPSASSAGDPAPVIP